MTAGGDTPSSAATSPAVAPGDPASTTRVRYCANVIDSFEDSAMAEAVTATTRRATACSVSTKTLVGTDPARVPTWVDGTHPNILHSIN